MQKLKRGCCTMNCPNCGRELYEGEVCTCTANTENVANAVPEQEPVQQPAQQPAAMNFDFFGM